MIKLILKNLLIVSVLSIVFTACSNSQPKVSSENRNSELSDAPNWIMNPEVKGYVSAIGSASQNAGNDFSFQRQEAMADARSNLAQQISVKVSTMFKSFKATTGSGKNATFDKTSEGVSKQISTQTLSGSKQKDTWISRSGTLYILMIVDTETVTKMMGKSIKTSFQNDEALYQKFLASEAQGDLKRELEKPIK